MPSRRQTVVLVIAGSYALFIGFSVLHESGQVGVTRKTTGVGCICHGASPTSTVLVGVSGPDSVRIGNRYVYTIRIKGGPAVAGGFDIAAARGVLSAAENFTYTQDGELTHATPKAFQGDSVQWSFYYQPPSSGTADTIFTAGNSTNLNGLPSGDEWNFGPDFYVQLLPDTSLGVSEGPRIKSFRLYQNFPNPFNPSTTISYSLAAGEGNASSSGSGAGRASLVTLKIYDILGREVAELVREPWRPGAYRVQWDATNFSDGIYFYKLQSGGYSETKKMTLVR
ncbi:MAG TPA: choice-of-anchor V domain-containing protein [Bacteroidota bacterium]|nr:choice-of-anchor V domain-containing protein [Bacteroidota bacterium]